MFIKDIDSQESYIHVCNGLKEKQMRQKAIEIRLHDVSIFSFVYDEKRDFKIESIKFCPYCGSDLDKEAFPDEEKS